MNTLTQNFIKLMAILFATLVLLIVLSMSLAERLQAAQDSTLAVPVSINALMVTLIDHSAHYIWDYGSMEREITDEEWRTVEYYAIQLSASGPLLTLGGSGSMDNTWAASPAWVDHARSMTEAATVALESARNKDKAALLSAGDALVQSCEGCHEDFKPEVPTEGITHQPDYDFLYHLFRSNGL